MTSKTSLCNFHMPGERVCTTLFARGNAHIGKIRDSLLRVFSARMRQFVSSFVSGNVHLLLEGDLILLVIYDFLYPRETIHSDTDNGNDNFNKYPSEF